MQEYTIIAIAGVIITQQIYIYLAERRHERVQKDLLNRLMAKDSKEYAEITGVKKQEQGIKNPVQMNLREDLVKQGYIKQ